MVHSQRQNSTNFTFIRSFAQDWPNLNANNCYSGMYVTVEQCIKRAVLSN